MEFEQTLNNLINNVEPRLWLNVLGPFQLLSTCHSAAIPCGAKAATVLSILAVREHHSASRDMVLSLLWPHQEGSLAAKSLNSLIYSLRRQLRQELGGAPPVLYTDGTYHLNLEAGIGIDVDYFRMWSAKGDCQFHAGNLSAAAKCYSEGIAFYHGDLCDVEGVYASVEREYLRACYLTMLVRLADYHFAQQHYDGCLRIVQQLLTSDPCREDGHRLAMRCYVQRGERAQALHQYHLCVHVLHSEFATTPEPATTVLYEQIREVPS